MSASPDWIPPDVPATCNLQSAITTCQTPTFVFLQLIAQLFGRTRDVPQRRFYGYADPLYEREQRTRWQRQQERLDAWSDREPGKGEEEQEAAADIYDFIIVGAGSAGCLMANRLSEVKQWKILLIEAGIEEPDVADVPSFAPMLQQSNIDWGFRTTPQRRSCLARDNRQCSWNRGRVMGGSSTINYMIYLRGHQLDYDQWASMGNPDWTYRHCLPYFVKTENNRQPDRVDAIYHGTAGELDVSTFPYQDTNANALLRALNEAGLNVFDQNRPGDTVGAMLMQHTTRDGERLSANRAFVAPIRASRRNLRVLTETRVVRVLIDPRTKTAYGVEYLTADGRVKRAFVTKEVVLSAGSLMSPKVLMLSGVGPRDHLRRVGIEPLVDSPVGRNLHDHATCDGVVFVLNATVTSVDEVARLADVDLYRATRRGPLSGTATLQVNAFVQTRYSDPERPDAQFSFDTIDVRDFYADPLLASSTKVLPLAYYDGIMVRPILLYPRSRGYILLNETHPVGGDPLIYANTFDEEVDLLTVVEAIKQSVNLLATPTMRALGARLGDTPLPACKHLRFASDAYWRCVAMQYTGTLYHPVGTCKMGAEKGDAVVDQRLRVHGVRNLRVIDSSVIPVVTRGNTNAPTYMVAERGADFVKRRWLPLKGGARAFDKFKLKKLVFG